MLSHLLHCSQNTVSLFFSAFQEHTQRMRKKLANQRQQEVDDEDDRIAKAVADRERKRDVCACFLIYVVKSTFLSVNVISTKVLIEDTVCLLLETGPLFFAVIRATRISSRLQGKWSTFISQLFLDLSVQCSWQCRSGALPTELLSSKETCRLLKKSSPDNGPIDMSVRVLDF